MTKEDKELLLKDLCARLPYGVKFMCNKNIYTAKGLDLIVTDEGDWEYAVTTKEIAPIEIDFIKPYLFPLSSMTEEQKKHITDRWGINEDFNFEIDPNWGEYIVELGDTINFINWLNENRFDINNLIPKGLAIDATGLNIYDKAKMNF